MSEQENTVEEIQPEVVEFREQVRKADGRLLPLRKTTPAGKKLYIAARHLKNPLKEENPDSDPGFYGWEDRHEPLTGVMLVDLYAEADAKITPLGHMDWWLLGVYANGGGNMHQAPVPKGGHEQLASERWHDYTAFKVDYEHHQQGYGSLMVATSAVVLPAIGIKRFYTGGLLGPAKKTYEHFGIRESDFPSRTQERHLPIERLSQNPQVNKIIAQFVT